MASTLKSAVLWSTATTFARLSCSFLSIKVTAIYLGPTGLALIGQFGNFISLLQSILGNAVNSAVVKMASEASVSDQRRTGAIVGTALRFLLVAGVVTGLALAAARRTLATWLLDDASFSPVILVLAVALPIILLGQLAVALFTAQRRFETVSLTNIVGTVASALIFVALCRLFGIWGGLVGIALTYSTAFFVAQWIGRGTEATRLLGYWRHADGRQLRSIVAFYPMLLANSLSLPLSMLLIRDMLIGNFGVEQAGLWQASVRLSDTYTMVFLGALSMYALPTLSAARDDTEFHHVLRRLVILCLGGAACTAAVMYLSRSLIVHLVFTQEFAQVEGLWPWRLVGDVFLVASWSMRSALMARERQVAYLAIEAGVGVGLFAVTKLLMAYVGIEAANIAYALVWCAVFVCLVVLHRRAFLGSSGRAERMSAS